LKRITMDRIGTGFSLQILLATDQHAYAATSESGPDCSAAGNGWPLRRAVRDDGPRA